MQALRLILSRLGMALLTMWLLSSAVFFSLRLLPGDPAALVLGDFAEERERAALRSKLKLDQPLWRQYGLFAVGVVTGELGPSLRQPGTSAAARVGKALPPTAALSGLSVALGALGGVGAALLGAGPWLGRWRSLVERAVIAVGATPLLALAPVATYVLAVRLRVVPLPGDPSAGFLGLLFAAGLLSLPLGVQVARVGRAALLDLGRAQFLSVARAKGASALRVWVFHALPAASAPIIAVVATQLGALLGGAVVLERLFERPGLGTLILEAYASRDLPVLEAAVVAAGGLFVATQTGAAAIHAAIDPRVRVVVRRWLGAAPALLIALGSSALALFSDRSPTRMELLRAWAPPSWALPLGASETGVDLLAALSHGTARVLLLSFSVVLFGFAVGTPLGAAAGLAGGLRATAVARACDLVQSFPSFLLALSVLAAVKTPGRAHIALVFCLTSWAPFARLSLLQSSVLRGAAFVEAARALGATRGRVLLRHVLPNLLGPVSVQTGSAAAAVVLGEAALGFLGLGPRDGLSLGSLLEQGTAGMLRAPHVLGAAALTVAAVSGSLQLASESLRQVFGSPEE